MEMRCLEKYVKFMAFPGCDVFFFGIVPSWLIFLTSSWMHLTFVLLSHYVEKILPSSDNGKIILLIIVFFLCVNLYLRRYE